MIYEWKIILSNVILDCIDAVNNGSPFDADPWIMIEEQIGYENTKLLFNDKEYLPITKSLDLYCFAAQHDRNAIEGISLKTLEIELTNSANMLKGIEPTHKL